MKVKNLNLAICKDDETGEFYFDVEVPEEKAEIIKEPKKTTDTKVTCTPDNSTPSTSKTPVKVETCKYNYGVCNAGSLGLNIRAKATTDSDIVGGLQTGQRFKIVAKVDDWYQISAPLSGYIDAKFTTVSEDTTSVSNALVNFTASYEGFSPTPYKDAGGNWTIGYGFCYYQDKPNFTMTETEAKAVLKTKLNEYAMKVAKLTTGLNLTQTEFDALVDFAYNLGVDALAGSDLLANIKTCCNNTIITDDFMAWDHCDGAVLPGLQVRRQNEAVLFLTGQYINN
jgi:GH24 family phage-related lysozyme (muramidase)